VENETLNKIHEKFKYLCDVVKEMEAITYGVNEIEDELLNLLNFIKSNKQDWDYMKQFFVKIVCGEEKYPLQIIIFCMRELKWLEIKKVTINELESAIKVNNSVSIQIANCMEDILAVYENVWDGSDMYKYYSSKKQ
jgi:hypothetical protein